MYTDVINHVRYVRLVNICIHISCDIIILYTTPPQVIRFKFKRTTHLYIGPPIAGVTQTQYLIRDGNDKCVVMTTVDIDGVPYSDVFAVEVRWAARRLQENGIAIDAGVFVRFTKASM